MIKILTILLFPYFVFANNFVQVPCEDLDGLHKLILGFATECKIDPTEYVLDMEIKNTPLINATIDYEDYTDVNVTISNNRISVVIAPDQAFRIKIGSFVSDRFKLRVYDSGIKWKYFYEGTRRWRNLSDMSLDANEALILKESVNISGRIINGAGYESITAGSSYVGKVKIHSGDKWEYIKDTNTTGWFSFSIKNTGVFTLSAFDG